MMMLKPGEDGKSWIVTLFNPSAKTASTRLQWPVPVKGTSISNTGEVALAPVKEAVELAPLEVVTLRVER